jgi:hypothetical protein
MSSRNESRTREYRDYTANLWHFERLWNALRIPMKVGVRCETEAMTGVVTINQIKRLQVIQGNGILIASLLG